MKEKMRKISLIIIVYFLSLILFLLFFDLVCFKALMNYYIKHAPVDNITPFAVVGVIFIPGICHFFFVFVIAIYAKINKKLAKYEKITYYSLPILTFILSLPMYALTLKIIQFFGI